MEETYQEGILQRLAFGTQDHQYTCSLVMAGICHVYKPYVLFLGSKIVCHSYMQVATSTPWVLPVSKM